MAAVDQLPPVPSRGVGGSDASPIGDLSSMFQGANDEQNKKDVQEELKAMRQRVGRMMRDVQTIAGQFPAASKEADMVLQGFDAMLKAIVKNAPGPEQSSPMVPA